MNMKFSKYMYVCNGKSDILKKNWSASVSQQQIKAVETRGYNHVHVHVLANCFESLYSAVNPLALTFKPAKNGLCVHIHTAWFLYHL